MAKLADNHLFYRIWCILNDYYKALEMKTSKAEKAQYHLLVDALVTKNGELILNRHRILRNMSMK